MTRAYATALMFEGRAQEAMDLYSAVFADAEVVAVQRYGPGEQGAEGSVKRADFRLGDHRMIFSDSPIKHGFTFTPSMSLFVDCGDEAELDKAFAALSAEGMVLMPPGNYGFSTKFTWVNDRFGVSWQLNLP